MLFRRVQRLDQLLASLGYGSRREVRTWIEGGRVTVSGRPEKNPGAKVEAEHVRIDNEALDHPTPLLLLLHKPAGFVCSHDDREGLRVYDLFPARWRARNPQLTSVGRLDRDTTGLLLVTDKSALVHRLTSPRHKVEKVYEATVDRDLPPHLGDLFATGTLLLEGEDKPCEAAAYEQIDARRARLTLTEGRYHQVKRMFASQRCNVTALHRSRFGPLMLDGLAPGQWRELSLDAL